LLLGVPVFMVDGVRPGVQGGVGVTWDPHADVGVSLDLGVAHFFAVPSGYDATLFVPSSRVEWRL
jgi:hypothetical protein